MKEEVKIDEIVKEEKPQPKYTLIPRTDVKVDNSAIEAIIPYTSKDDLGNEKVLFRKEILPVTDLQTRASSLIKEIAQKQAELLEVQNRLNII